jgi:preprotein translocase subunit SecG
MYASPFRPRNILLTGIFLGILMTLTFMNTKERVTKILQDRAAQAASMPQD